MEKSNDRPIAVLKVALAGLVVFVVSVLVCVVYFGNAVLYQGVEGRVISREARSSGISQGDTGVSFDSRVPEDSKTEKTESVKILFGGDVMFDRNIRESAERNGGYGFLFGKMQDQLASEDLVVVNLEGPITSQLSKSVGSKMGEARNYSFTFDPIVANVLKEHHIQVVNVGNNHIMNFGKEGLAETRRYLEEAGVEYFGDPGDVSHRWLLREVKGLKMAFVNYNQFAVGSREAVFEDISQARKQADIVVVYTHWGTEYVPANDTQKQLAHAFIDAGADVVIGSHPHVVQESEEYKGKKIYYSLGNFIFDQYFSEETRSGLLAEMIIDRDTKRISFLDIQVALEKDGQVFISNK